MSKYKQRRLSEDHLCLDKNNKISRILFQPIEEFSFLALQNFVNSYKIFQKLQTSVEG